MREDRFTSTEHDAGLFESHVVPDYGDDRPTRAEAERDECEHDNQHKDTRVVWVCDDCGQVCDEDDEP